MQRLVGRSGPWYLFIFLEHLRRGKVERLPRVVLANFGRKATVVLGWWCRHYNQQTLGTSLHFFHFFRARRELVQLIGLPEVPGRLSVYTNVKPSSRIRHKTRKTEKTERKQPPRARRCAHPIRRHQYTFMLRFSKIMDHVCYTLANKSSYRQKLPYIHLLKIIGQRP